MKVEKENNNNNFIPQANGGKTEEKPDNFLFSLNSLSDELIVKIFCCLNAKKLGDVSLLSKRMYAIANDNQLWHEVLNRKLGVNVQAEIEDYKQHYKDEENSFFLVDIALLQRANTLTPDIMFSKFSKLSHAAKVKINQHLKVGGRDCDITSYALGFLTGLEIMGRKV